MTITKMIGASHSFLRTRKKAQSSLMKFIVLLELILESVSSRARRYTVDPVGVAVCFFQA